MGSEKRFKTYKCQHFSCLKPKGPELLLNKCQDMHAYSNNIFNKALICTVTVKVDFTILQTP